MRTLVVRMALGCGKVVTVLDELDKVIDTVKEIIAERLK